MNTPYTNLTCTLYGRTVPARDYETLRQLERIAFGLTPSDWHDTTAHAIALDAAQAALELLRRAIASAERQKAASR